MEAGHYQLQIFVSLVVILASAVVALLCDFLKTNNDQLRELNIALREQLPDGDGREWATELGSEWSSRTGQPAGPRPLAGREGKRPGTVISIAEAAVAFRGKSRKTVFPGGLHDRSTLEARLRQNGQISGAVIAVGFEETGGSFGHNETSMNSAVRELMTSLLGEVDFACPWGQREYLLVFPNERGGAAQRRIGDVAEQLLDFQLRSVATLSIGFSWGGVEAQRERLADAVASARERMHETRRNRKTGSAIALRQKVV